MTPHQRCQAYHSTFPTWPAPSVGSDGRIQGMWLLGQDYRSKQHFYGEYPPNYLRRILALFPDIPPENILHLFSGALSSETPGTRVDIRPELKPDIVCDAHNLLGHLPPGSTFPLVLADPPYSAEDAEHYGTVMVNRKDILRQLSYYVPAGGFVVWLDQVWPMYGATIWSLAGLIGIVRSTNHRVRVAFIFERLP